jgi:histone acetyltransferase (RNA polymerase elongator complex component)
VTGAPPRLPSAEDIERVAALYLASAKAARLPRQLAFYGGTFTLLPVADQERLLAIARGYLERGQVESLRLSTRPDAVDEATLDRLRAWGVRTVELGAQSFDDTVLGLARRGHTAAQTMAAARRVKEAGLELGLQLMCGLPGESAEGFLASCRAAASLRPDLVRLYPVLVLEGTGLARWWRQGRYVPLSLAEAIERCRMALDIFGAEAIPVARIGLPASEGLERAVLAGPYHPALGDLVRQATHPSQERVI